MRFSFTAAAASATMFCTLATATTTSSTAVAAPTSFMVNVTVADLNAFSGIQAFDPANSTEILHTLDQYGDKPESYGVSYTVNTPGNISGTKEDVSHECEMKCLTCVWWGPLVYAICLATCS